MQVSEFLNQCSIDSRYKNLSVYLADCSIHNYE